MRRDEKAWHWDVVSRADELLLFSFRSHHIEFTHPFFSRSVPLLLSANPVCTGYEPLLLHQMINSSNCPQNNKPWAARPTKAAKAPSTSSLPTTTHPPAVSPHSRARRIYEPVGGGAGRTRSRAHARAFSGRLQFYGCGAGIGRRPPRRPSASPARPPVATHPPAYTLCAGAISVDIHSDFAIRADIDRARIRCCIRRPRIVSSRTPFAGRDTAVGQRTAVAGHPHSLRDGRLWTSRILARCAQA